MNVPPGTILLWSGAIVDIPEHFVLCDGNNGTPNLTGRFIIGAGDAYDPDDQGGTFSHTHTFTTDGHDHTFGAGTDMQAGPDYDNDTDIAVDTGTTQPTVHFPPFYALAYIMREI